MKLRSRPAIVVRGVAVAMALSLVSANSAWPLCPSLAPATSPACDRHAGPGSHSSHARAAHPVLVVSGDAAGCHHAARPGRECPMGGACVTLATPALAAPAASFAFLRPTHRATSPLAARASSYRAPPPSPPPQA